MFPLSCKPICLVKIRSIPKNQSAMSLRDLGYMTSLPVDSTPTLSGGGRHHNKTLADDNMNTFLSENCKVVKIINIQKGKT